MIPVILAMTLSAQATAPAPDAAFPKRLESAEAREVLEVPRTLTRIEEKGLPIDALRSNQALSAPSSRKAGGTIADLTDQGQRGMRLLAFELEPGEKISFKLVLLDSSRMQIGLAPAVQPDEMTQEIQRVNRLQAASRTRKIETENKAGRPYPLVLRITGSPGIPYSLEIERRK